MQIRTFGLVIIGLFLLVLGGACSSAPTQSNQQPAQQPAQQQPPATPAQAAQAPAEEGIRLRPVDGAAQDASFEAFRRTLLDAAQRRDTEFVISILDRQIMNRFGGRGGVAEFREHWKPERPDSQLWEVLHTVLSNGGSFRVVEGERQFCAPYAYSEWMTVANQLPEIERTWQYAAITGENVALRREPDANAPAVAMLSYNIVRTDLERSVAIPNREGSYTWVRVTTLSGKEGYVPGASVYGNHSYKACFEKAGERWLMTGLFVGD